MSSRYSVSGSWVFPFAIQRCFQQKSQPVLTSPNTRCHRSTRHAIQDCFACSEGSYCETTGLVEPTGPCSGGYYCKRQVSTAAPTSGESTTASLVGACSMPLSVLALFQLLLLSLFPVSCFPFRSACHVPDLILLGKKGEKKGFVEVGNGSLQVSFWNQGNSLLSLQGGFIVEFWKGRRTHRGPVSPQFHFTHQDQACTSSYGRLEMLHRDKPLNCQQR